MTWTQKQCEFELVQSSFELVQRFCIKEHGKQHVFCGTGPGYNQNSLLDCLEQQCSIYPNSSHHSPDLAFQMSPHGSQPFLNRTITKLSLSNGWRLFWYGAISLCCHQRWLCFQDWGAGGTSPAHTHPSTHSQTLPTW